MRDKSSSRSVWTSPSVELMAHRTRTMVRAQLVVLKHHMLGTAGRAKSTELQITFPKITKVARASPSTGASSRLGGPALTEE